jgi:dimethylhistidine N-methyltransferase
LDSRRTAVTDFVDLHAGADRFLEEVTEGLARPRKALPPKYFYDERGADLFEAICELPEYYLTRAELAIMAEHAGEMAGHLGPDCAVIEYGSGSGRKTRLLLKALAPVAYVPIDISRSQLQVTASGIADEFPGLSVTAVCADYSRALSLPPLAGAPARRRVVYFPGSTIGNLTPVEAAGFLANARRLAGPGGGMLVGVDLKKDAARLTAAYNDARGITAEFNLNLLARINRELGADFDLAAFRHHAFYSAAEGRVEMHLVSCAEQRVRVGNARFSFRGGETIHTESSYKYSVEEFGELARGAGFRPEWCWTGAGREFAVHYLAVPE